MFFILSCSTSVKDTSSLPGRLGDSEMSLKNDPRAIPAGDMIFIKATPKIYRSSLMHINNFANSL